MELEPGEKVKIEAMHLEVSLQWRESWLKPLKEKRQRDENQDGEPFGGGPEILIFQRNLIFIYHGRGK